MSEFTESFTEKVTISKTEYQTLVMRFAELRAITNKMKRENIKDIEQYADICDMLLTKKKGQ